MDLPQPPTDQELRNIIDKLAQFVARNGPEFEHMTKTKQKNNPKFSFLYGGEHYHYYTYKVNAEQAILRQKGHPPPNMAQFNRPPPNLMSPKWQRPPGFRGPPPNFANSPRQPPPRMSGPPPDWSPASTPPPTLSKPRPLMEIPLNSGEKDEIDKEIGQLQEQIKQSEQNLAAQKLVMDDQIKEMTNSTIRKSRLEHLELLSHDTGVSLNEIDAMLQPIIESCTKETIGSGKVWIFQFSNSHDRNRLLAHHLAFKVTEASANFQLKLHMLYLMNDVVHHCVRKNNDDLKGSLESVAVEMFCSAWLSSNHDAEKQNKLSKLVKLWEEKEIFSTVTLRRMREDPQETWSACADQHNLDYESAIKNSTQHLVETYANYSSQHHAFVAHAQNSIANLQKRRSEIKESTQPKKTSSRGSRWDTGSDGQAMPHHQLIPGPNELVLPDLSRPPPGFEAPPKPNQSSLMPTLPYHDLPAGLMVPLIKLEDSGYKPLNPKDLRLPPPSPPTDRLLAAIDQFYAPPSHDRPRDPEGWEMLALYEWSRAKTAAIKKKADDIEFGRRQRSPSASPEPYFEERSRSRSRTRSRSSRESTPEKRSISPEESYPLPSYLTKRSPSPVASAEFKGFGSDSANKGHQKLDSSNKGHQMMQKMGWKGSGLGSSEDGIVEPISGGEVRDRQDQFRGVGHGADPFEAFRKSKAGSFYTRMKERDKERDRKSSGPAPK